MFILTSKNALLIGGGVGFFDGVHAKVDYHYKRFALGVGYGQMKDIYPYLDGVGKITSFNGSFYFGATNTYGYSKKYLTLGVYHMLYEDIHHYRSLYFLSPCFGRDFYLNRFLGINLQAGLIAPFYSKSTRKENDYDLSFWIYPVMPEVSVRLFVRL